MKRAILKSMFVALVCLLIVVTAASAAPFVLEKPYQMERLGRVVREPSYPRCKNGFVLYPDQTREIVLGQDVECIDTVHGRVFGGQRMRLLAGKPHTIFWIYELPGQSWRDVPEQPNYYEPTPYEPGDDQIEPFDPSVPPDINGHRGGTRREWDGYYGDFRPQQIILERDYVRDPATAWHEVIIGHVTNYYNFGHVARAADQLIVTNHRGNICFDVAYAQWVSYNGQRYYPGKRVYIPNGVRFIVQLEPESQTADRPTSENVIPAPAYRH